MEKLLTLTVLFDEEDAPGVRYALEQFLSLTKDFRLGCNISVEDRVKEKDS